uniref:uncharacterized protein LOC120348084 n=1 Tax=Styela clava TaxID=7725 RepID=UPI00193A1BF3|nr:uncharacterized protein LOC120348084 [Styela clava]
MNAYYVACYGLISLTFSSVLALQCYRCSSAINGACDDKNLVSAQLTQCVSSGPLRERFCSKVTTSGPSQATMIMRTCSVSDVNDCRNINGNTECTTTCTSDGCNKGFTIRPVVMSTILWIFLVILVTDLMS